MKKNVVLIETLDSVGTGILYPCKYENEKSKFCNYFIIFTNSHVLKNVGRDVKPDQDVKELVKLQIFDDAGKCVENEDILEIHVYNQGWNYEKQNDIAALLVAVHGQIVLTLELNIFTNTLENRSTIYMEGYPGVMLDDEVSQKLQLEGISKSIFPESNKIGVYQITDDYHWYNGLQDRQLLSGLSGSPVYIEHNGQEMLIGMNQSVSDIARGENPFKLVYYLKMEYILGCLREAGCILFQRRNEYAYQIEWVLGKENIINNYTNKPAFLLIGGSGAGKSSFATDFAYHGDELSASNDGQTTRTSVIYEYRIFEKNPCAVVQFMQKQVFQDRMLELKGARGILFIFHSLFGLSEDICQNEYKLLEDCDVLLEKIKKRYGVDDAISVKEFMEDKEVRKDKENLIRWYEGLLECILDGIPFLMVRYVCDREWVEKCREDYQDSYEKQFQVDNVGQEKNFFEKYVLKDIKKRYKEREVGLEYEKIIKLMKETQIFDTLVWYCKQKRGSFREYQSNCQEKCLRYIRKIDAFEEKNHRICDQKIFTNEFKIKYINHLLFCEGFFDITEFSFLKSSQDIQNEIVEEIGDKLIAKELRRKEGEGIRIVDYGILEGIKLVYDCCHDILINAMIVRNVGIRENNYKITISLKKMKEEERKFLQRCLQVADGQSFTGIVHTVKIQDMVANLYAMELKNLKISQIKIVDTHGLDHVQGVWSMEDALYDIVYTCQEQKIQLHDLNVLYLKKLDSGKPDELRNILPMIYKVIPQSPVYCVFSGIDIFYQTQEEIYNIKWERSSSEKAPKAIRYILSPKGQQELMENLQGSAERKKNMYLVLKNNLIPYCGKQELLRKCYVYYKNNLIYVRKLLASIVMKEYSSLEIISLDKLKKIIEYTDYSEVKSVLRIRYNSIDKEIKEFREKTETLIKLIFQRASINVNRVHHQTLKADLRNIGEHELLGYWRSYRHQWNQRFHEAYAEVISKMGGELAECYGTAQGAFEAALSNMEQRFLGESEHLWNRELEENVDKSEFRIYLEEMFAQPIYNRNPFKENFTEVQLKEMGTEKRKELYCDFFDFAKGLYNETILQKFTDKFIRDLEVQIEADNAAKAENVIMLNHDFVEALNRLEDIFVQKYDIDGTNNMMDFYYIMQYYFKGKKDGFKKEMFDR